MSVRKWRRCPHVRIRGIYGDEVIFASPGHRRLQCLDCGRHLDGPVSLATHISINGGIFPAEYEPVEDEGDDSGWCTYDGCVRLAGHPAPHITDGRGDEDSDE